MKSIYYALLICVSVCALSCQTERQINQNQLVIRFESEPDRLNPILSTGSYASQIEGQIFQPLAELDPITLNFEPILIERIPALVRDERQEFGPVDRLDIKIKDSARWSDGKPVSNVDVLFTLKVILTPDVKADRKRTIFSFVRGEKHDENDSKFLSLYVDTARYNAKRIALNFHILPQHIYDSVGLLNNIPLNDLIANNISSENEKSLTEFSDLFRTERFSRTTIIGSGPYELDYWNTGYEIQLKRKQNWWGDAYAENNLFKAIPKELRYRIIPDQQLAITAMANNNIDIIAGVTPEKFSVLRETQPELYQYLTPVIPRFFYIILNTESSILKDPQTRKALAFLVDQQKLIEVVMSGYGRELSAPILPMSKLYNDKIKPYPFDVQQANELLKTAGWTSFNDDGILIREREGNLEELKLDIKITGSRLGRQIALILQNNFKKAGIDLEIKAQKFSNTRQDMQKGDFNLVATAASQALGEPNLKSSWHSTSISSSGGNLSRIASDQIDKVLDDLADEENPEARIKLYHEFHSLIHEEVPVLFLLMPTECVLVSKSWHVDESARRPGYFENMAYPEK